jgi:nucleotide-binding universal stress UspA family protein
MYRAILIALGDAELDRAALSAGIQLARAAHARLHLVHVRRQTTTLAGHDAAQSALLEAVRKTSEELGVPVASELIEPPTGLRQASMVAAQLIRYSADHDIDLIVMGTHARSRVKRSILGSVADGLIRATHLPILLIPRAKGTGQIHLRLRRLLVPLDGSPAAEQILPDATALAKLLAGSIVVIRVIPPEPVHGPFATDGYPMPLAHEEFVLRRARSEEYLDRIADRIEKTGVAVDALTLAADRVSRAIDSAAATREIDVVAIATGGSSAHPLLHESGTGDAMIEGARRGLLIKSQESVAGEPLKPNCSCPDGTSCCTRPGSAVGHKVGALTHIRLPGEKPA